MSYQDQAELSRDMIFNDRMTGCVTTESRTRLPDSPVAVLTMGNPAAGVSAFMPWVTSEPGFDVPQDQVSDAMLLAAVQSVWGQVDAQLAAAG